MNPGRHDPIASDLDRIAAARLQAERLRAILAAARRQGGWCVLVPHALDEIVTFNPRRSPAPQFNRRNPS